MDFTYKIIPKAYKPYKLMTIYYINKEDRTKNLAAFICIKYTDKESLKKLFSILRATYNFSPKFVTTDYDGALLNSLKTCEMFNTKPVVIPCFFHYSQCLIRKLKHFHIIKNKLNKKGYEILRNLEILCFVKKNKIKTHFTIIKENLAISENEKLFFQYIRKYLVKKDDLFNYYE